MILLMKRKRTVKWKVAQLATKKNIKNAHALHLLAGVSYSSVRSLWMDENVMPTIRILQPIANVLKCKIEDLYKEKNGGRN